MPLLEVKDLSYSVRRRKLFSSSEPREILKTLSISVEEGSVTGLIGESGSGKTTLARCISGLCEPTAGRIIFRGLELFPETRNRELIRKEIQLLFQNHTSSLDPEMTIHRSLLEGRDAGTSAGEPEVRRLLSLVDLPIDVLPRRPRELSGGQRQRVALARALSVSPRLLILDEPTSALDALTQEQIFSTILRIRKESRLTIIHISHDLQTTAAIADSIAVMKSGTIVEFASRDQLLRSPRHVYTRELLQAGGLNSV